MGLWRPTKNNTYINPDSDILVGIYIYIYFKSGKESENLIALTLSLNCLKSTIIHYSYGLFYHNNSVKIKNKSGQYSLWGI